jgi:G-protein signaling modulator 2
MQNLTLNELAGEGERLCKLGDCQNGLRYFEEALKVYNDMKLLDGYGSNSDCHSIMTNSTENDRYRLLQTISIIYNQMGNAHFYLQNYEKALYYHKKDLEISERFNDEPGKAKACGNIGNTLQLLGDYDEAILYSLRNLDISIKLNDLVIITLCLAI